MEIKVSKRSRYSPVLTISCEIDDLAGQVNLSTRKCINLIFDLLDEGLYEDLSEDEIVRLEEFVMKARGEFA